MATVTNTSIVIIRPAQGQEENPTFIPCIRGPAMVDLVARAGENPADYNRFRWPVGASDFGSCRVLIHDEDIRPLIENASIPAKPFQFVFGEINADRMYARDIRPIHGSNIPRNSTVGADGGTVWSVLLVDERYYWNRANARDASPQLAVGYNLYDQTRGAFLEGTSPGTDEPYTPREIIDQFLEGLFDNLLIDGTDLTDALSKFDRASVLLDAEDAIRDFWADGADDVGKLIDDVARMAGCYLTAFPQILGTVGNPGWGISPTNPNGGLRYAFRSHRDGPGIVRDILQDTQSYKGGGWYGSAATYGFTSGEIGEYVTGEPDFLNPEVPERVAVYFPKAPSDGTRWDLFGSSTSAGLVDAPTDRWEIVNTAEGAPPNIDRQGVQTIHSTLFAQINAQGNVLNLSEIQAESERLSSRYYDRFYAGVGNAILLGHPQVEPTSGMQTVSWIIDGASAWTLIRGDFEWRGFGFSHQPRKLDRSDILTAGTVRALPRADGRVLIDGIPQTSYVWPAIITKNTSVGADGGPIYDAVAVDDSSVGVVDATPINREFDPAIVTHNPADLGDRCYISQTASGDRDLIAFEINPVQDCEDAGLGARVWFGT